MAQHIQYGRGFTNNLLEGGVGGADIYIVGAELMMYDI